MKTTTRTPKQNRSIQKKEQIIAAAMLLFSDKGYYDINSKDIAKEAGVSVGTFYAYFKDKKEVFLCLLDNYKTKINESVLARLSRIDSIDSTGQTDLAISTVIETILSTIIGVIKTYPKGFYNQIIVLSKTDDDIKDRYNDHMSYMAGEIGRHLIKQNLGQDNPLAMDVLSKFIVHLNEACVTLILNEDNEALGQDYKALYANMLSMLLTSN